MDSHVGQRLRLRRTMLGVSQERLGEAVGVSFQMIQKYERGDCRVGAGRLIKVAQALQVPVTWFFEGQDAPSAAISGALAEDANLLDEGVFQKKETLDLLRAYYALPEAMRRHVFTMIKGLGKDGETPDDGAAAVGKRLSA